MLSINTLLCLIQTVSLGCLVILKPNQVIRIHVPSIYVTRLENYLANYVPIQFKVEVLPVQDEYRHALAGAIVIDERN